MTTPELGTRLPELHTPIPGPASRAMADRLRRVESRNVTYVDDAWPVFWQDARGANVVDADGNVFIDLTSAFGVGLLGHRSDPLEGALAEQGLIHGMGDIHPPAVKLELLERLVGITPWAESRVVLASTGSEAVEIGLKTGALVSGRPGVLAFEGAYHGLTLGSLAVTPRPHFRAFFEERLYGGVAFAPFPDPIRDQDAEGAHTLREVERLLDRGAPNGDAIGTIVVEPVQARGGARVPPEGFMAALSDLASSRGVTIVADEIFTGIGRCGAMLASERVGLRPDIVCVGKTLGAGLPISACIGSADVMDAWPDSTGEAIHTSTFLGHPLACAAAIRVLDTMADGSVAAEIDRVGASIFAGLRSRLDGVRAVGDIRGLGLLLGIELVEADGTTKAAGAGVRIAERVLRDGIISLPAGDVGEVYELTPPVVLTDEQRDHALDRIAQAIVEMS
jgi:4-aminobutyrate aminotransferase/(S)-3-amino-2-methylpropionate transaminase